MPIPTSYTETTLALFMQQRLRGLVHELNWGDLDEAPYPDAVTDTLIKYGVRSIEAATNVVKLRAIAAYIIWKAAFEECSGRYHWTADGASFHEDQLFNQVSTALKEARSEAAPYLPVVESLDVAITTSIKNQVTW